jgi:hypothetical protein
LPKYSSSFLLGFSSVGIGVVSPGENIPAARDSESKRA